MKDAYQLNLVSIALVIRRNSILPTSPHLARLHLPLVFLKPRGNQEGVAGGICNFSEYVFPRSTEPDNARLHFGWIAEKAHGFISQELWRAHAARRTVFVTAGVSLTCKWTCLLELGLSVDATTPRLIAPVKFIYKATCTSPLMKSGQNIISMMKYWNQLI